MTPGRALRQILFTAALVLTLKACGVLPLGAEPILRMDVTPRQVTVPGKVTLRITVFPDPAIRVLCTGLNGAKWQSSCREWAPGEPAHLPRTVFVSYTIQQAGPHTATVEAQDSRGIVLARVDVEVCATGGQGGAVCD